LRRRDRTTRGLDPKHETFEVVATREGPNVPDDPFDVEDGALEVDDADPLGPLAVDPLLPHLEGGSRAGDAARADEDSDEEHPNDQ